MKTTIWKSWMLSCAHRLPHVAEGHKCGRVHGHNYTVEVYVTGPVQSNGEQRGMVIDFAALDGIWRERVDVRLDHRCLNDIAGLENPTSEVLCDWVARVFEAWIPATVKLVKVVVQEKNSNGAVLESDPEEVLS